MPQWWIATSAVSNVSRLCSNQLAQEPHRSGDDHSPLGSWLVLFPQIGYRLCKVLRSDVSVVEVTTSRPAWWRAWIAPLVIAAASTSVLYLAIRVFRSANKGALPEGYRIQDWSSNWMMQTLGLEEMIPFGPAAFWYSHVYPPLEDMIRYVFTFPETSVGEAVSPMAVDFRLYALYAVLYGLTNALLYVWVRSLTRNGWVALAVTVVWAIHPGYITIMTLLESSPLAMFTISLSLFFLYMFLRYRNLAWSTAFLAALLLASLARTVTQLHVLAILFVAVISFWFISHQRKWWLLALNILLVALLCAIPVKMKILYDTWDVTTYGGYHRVGPLWIDPRTVAEPVYPQKIVDNALAFSSRYNTQEQVKDNYRLGAAAGEFLVQNPVESVGRLAKSLAITVPEILRPSSTYTQNYFVEKLPWRDAWDWLFSGWPYLIMISAAAIGIGWSRGWRGVGRLFIKYGWFAVFYGLLALPILFSNRYRPGEEDAGPIWTDAIRQKVFVEMPIWALVGYASWLGISRLRRNKQSKFSGSQSSNSGR